MPQRSWWARLPFGVRMAVGGSALLVLIGGGAAGIAALTEEEPRIVTAVGQTGTALAPASPADPGAVAAPTPTTDATSAPDADAGDSVVDSRTADQADRTGNRTPRRTEPEADRPAAGSAAGARAPVRDEPPAPVVTTETVTETRSIPYRTRLVRDPHMPRGEKRVQRPGVPGEEVRTYRVTYTDGKPTDRELVESVVTKEPKHRVIAFGTRRDRGDGPKECRVGPCIPLGRDASCTEPVTPVDPTVTESAPVRVGASVSLLDQDVYLLEPSELDGLELDPALLC